MASLGPELLVVSLRDLSMTKSDLCRSYATKTPSPSPNHLYPQQERNILQARGKRLHLPNSGPVYLRDTLGRAEELLLQGLPVSINQNSYPYHQALQVVLQDCSVLSYVFDDDGNLARVYIDDSSQKFMRTACTASLHTADKLILHTENQMTALVNSGREKSKRPFVTSSGKGIVSTVPTNGLHALGMYFNSTGDLLCAYFKDRVSIFLWKHLSSIKAVVNQHAMKQDDALSLSLSCELMFEQSRVIFCTFAVQDSNKLLVIYEDRRDSSQVIATHIVYDSRKHSLRLAGEQCCIQPLDQPVNTKDDEQQDAAALQVSTVGRGPLGRQVVLGCGDGTLILLSVDSQTGHIFEKKRIKAAGKFHPTRILWHSFGAMFAVCWMTGHISLFDAALQPLKLLMDQGYLRSTISLQKEIGSNISVIDGVWGAPNEKFCQLHHQTRPYEELQTNDEKYQSQRKRSNIHSSYSSSSTAERKLDKDPYEWKSEVKVHEKSAAKNDLDHGTGVDVRHTTPKRTGSASGLHPNSLALILDNGPLVIIRFMMGGVGQANASFTHHNLLSQRLRNGQIRESIESVRYTNWSNERFLCLSMLINHLFRSSNSGGKKKDCVSSLGEVFNYFWPYYSSPTNKHHVSMRTLFTRYLHVLLRLDKFEEAFEVARKIHSRSTYQDVYAHAMRQERYTLADIVLSVANQPLNTLTSSVLTLSSAEAKASATQNDSLNNTTVSSTNTTVSSLGAFMKPLLPDGDVTIKVTDGKQLQQDINALDDTWSSQDSGSHRKFTHHSALSLADVLNVVTERREDRHAEK